MPYRVDCSVATPASWESIIILNVQIISKPKLEVNFWAFNTSELSHGKSVYNELMRNWLLILVILLLLVLILLQFRDEIAGFISPSPTPTLTSTSTPTETYTVTPSPSFTPSPTETNTPTYTLTPSETPTETPTWIPPTATRKPSNGGGSKPTLPPTEPPPTP